MQRQWSRGEYAISTERERLDVGVIHAYLRRSYWAPDRTRDRVLQSLNESLCFGLYHSSGAQVGFARVVTDYVAIAFLADVFVLEEHRGKGLGVWLVGVATGLPELGHVRRWLLGTRDAQELYRKFDFVDVPAGALMQRLDPESDLEPR